MLNNYYYNDDGHNYDFDDIDIDDDFDHNWFVAHLLIVMMIVDMIVFY